MKRPKVIVRDFLTRTLTGSNPCARISLHCGNSRSDPLLERKVTVGEYEGGNFDSFVDEILALVDDDDDEPDTYCLKAVYDDDESVMVSKPITAKSSAGNPERMMLSQAHRHIEVLTRGIASMLDTQARYQATRSEHELDALEKYGDIRQRMLLAEQENADRSHERQLEAKREERQAAWIDGGIKALMNMVPMLAGQLAGIVPQGAAAVRASPQYQTLRGLFENRTEEEWPSVQHWLMSAPLPAADLAAFKLVIESVVADMIADEAEKAKTNGKVSTSAPVRH